MIDPVAEDGWLWRKNVASVLAEELADPQGWKVEELAAESWKVEELAIAGERPSTGDDLVFCDADTDTDSDTDTDTDADSDTNSDSNSNTDNNTSNATSTSSKTGYCAADKDHKSWSD